MSGDEERYLKVTHGEDLLAPLQQECSTDVEVEVGEALSFSLTNTQAGMKLQLCSLNPPDCSTW